MAENTVSPVWSAQILPISPGFAESTSRGEVTGIREPVAEWKAKEDLKWYLMNKYRVLFMEKITPGDLEELRNYLRQHDLKDGWNREHNKRFVLKMKGYVDEEILKREIAGIVSLLTLMNPEDLSQLPGMPPAKIPVRVTP